MKRFLAGALILLLSPALFGCEKQTGIEDKYKDITDYFVYENIDYNSPLAITAGEGAELFAAEVKDGAAVIRKYSENGEIASEFPVNYFKIYDMYYSENSLYIGVDGSGCAAVDRLDLSSGETERVCEFAQLSDIRSVSEIDGEIVAIGTDDSKSGLECQYMISSYRQVEYKGRAVYSFKDNEVTELVTDFPFEAEGFGNSVIIYGCNDDEGFYFRKYDSSGLSEPSYTDQLGEVKSMCAFGEDCYITSSISRFNTSTVVAGNISGSGASEIMPNIFIFGLYRRELTANDSFCWYLDDNSKTLTRIKLSAYYKGNKTMTLLCSNLSGIPPFSCGYDIRLLRPGNDEAALKILSQDRDYDICYLSSRDTISGNIRDKGSFYPLNDVAGISEYMDSLFPYMKDACTNENGEIWCLPISSEVLTLFYNDERCKELGFDMRNISVEDYFDFIDTVKQNDLNKNCGYSSYWYTEAYLMKYLTENNSFDTEEFRKTAGLIVDRFPYDMLTLNFNYIDNSVYTEAAYENKCEEFIADMIIDAPYLNNTTLRAAPCPYPTDGSPISLVYLCVNPASAQLSDALDYIASLAQYTKSQKNIFLFTDKNGYSDTAVAGDLYDIFSGGKVGYAYPDDIYRTDFESCIDGKITIDEFIIEANRKLAAYLNE